MSSCVARTCTILVALAAPAAAQITTRVSVGNGGVEGLFYAEQPSMTPDARFVAFASGSPNLVANDTNGYPDVFLRDRSTGTTELLNLNSSGVQGDSQCYTPSLSADGTRVAFQSWSTNLVANDTNGTTDVFVRDRVSGVTVRATVSSAGVEANFHASPPSLSADGRWVAYSNQASTLVAGDTNGVNDVFVHDLLTSTTTRVSVGLGGAQANAPSLEPAISGDGRYVVFRSGATNLVAGDTNGIPDLFVRDRQLGTNTLVSLNSLGVQQDSDSWDPAITPDGRYVAFTSFATNLVAGDTNNANDVFVRDLQTGTTERISVSSAGAQADSDSDYAALSADGRYVSFQSWASNLDGADANGIPDFYLRDRLTNTTTRISIGIGGVDPDGGGYNSVVSDDGRYVAFENDATNLVPGDTNGSTDIFVRDRGTPPGVGYCAGDGTLLACPCGNNGSSGRGCANSTFASGALLGASGLASVANDQVLFAASGMSGSIAVFFQGATSTAPTIIDDGIGCVGGPIIRLGNKVASAGASSFPQPGDPSVSVRGAIPAAGGTYFYQCFYRNAVAAFCPPATSNRTNGMRLSWIP